MIRAAIIGATGYTGQELLRYLLRHPGAALTHCTSESSAGKSIFEVHPTLSTLKREDRILQKANVERIARDTDVAFLCLPHAQSARMGKQLLARGLKVIDLSADYRLKSAAEYKRWYGIAHPNPELLKKAVYGLPELHRNEIADADLIANPGCYATTSILSALPLVAAGWADPSSIVIDAKSGVSGAGRKAENRTLFCEDNENFLAYAVANHRHAPEIEQELNLRAKGGKVSLTFVPHLLPINRGILATVYAKLKRNVSNQALWDAYHEFYREEPFVQVLPLGQFPEVRAVQFTNFCQIGVRVDERNRRAVIVGTLDNLGKGASSQAVQNMNLRFGLDERSGLI